MNKPDNPIPNKNAIVFTHDRETTELLRRSEEILERSKKLLDSDRIFEIKFRKLLNLSDIQLKKPSR